MKQYNSDKVIEKYSTILLVFLNLLFVVYWVSLSIHYCLHYDDVHFMWKLRDMSICEYVKEMYLSRGGNFVGYGINGVIFTISNLLGFYQFWPILFYSLGILLTFYAFKDLINWNSRWNLFICVITLYNIYILTSVDFAVFTWLCAMGYYLYAPSLCLFLKYLNSNRLSLANTIVFICLSLFIAGSNVSFSCVSFVVLFMIFLRIWHNNNWNIYDAWNDNKMRRLLWITCFMLVIFVIMVIAPGNYLRMADEFDIEQPSSIYDFIIACGKCIFMYLYLTSFYLPYYFIVFVLGYYIGTYKKDNYHSRKRTIIRVWAIYFIYLLICVMPLAYLSNGFQIQRNYTQLTYFMIIAIFITGYVFSNKNKCLNVIVQNIGIISAFFMLIVMMFNIFQDIPVAIAYDKAHKEREKMLLQLKARGNSETVMVEPFPSTHTPDAKYNILKFIGKSTYMPSIYYDSDTNIEPNEYEGHIKRLLNIDFDFVYHK